MMLRNLYRINRRCNDVVDGERLGVHPALLPHEMNPWGYRMVPILRRDVIDVTSVFPGGHFLHDYCLMLFFFLSSVDDCSRRCRLGRGFCCCLTLSEVRLEPRMCQMSHVHGCTCGGVFHTKTSALTGSTTTMSTSTTKLNLQKREIMHFHLELGFLHRTFVEQKATTIDHMVHIIKVLININHYINLFKLCTSTST